MIVKTGANYQAEGGYIEASTNGSLYTLTDNDTSVTFSRSEELGLFSVPVTIINETGGSLAPTCRFKLGDIENVLGTPATYSIGVGETVTVNCLGITGIPMRIGYSVTSGELKCESEYITIESAGRSEAAFTIVKMPENGEPITMRLYI